MCKCCSNGIILSLWWSLHIRVINKQWHFLGARFTIIMEFDVFDSRISLIQKYGIIHQTSAFLWYIEYWLVVIRDTLPSVLIMRYNVKPGLFTTFMGRTFWREISLHLYFVETAYEIETRTWNIMTYLFQSVSTMSLEDRSTLVSPIEIHSTWKSSENKYFHLEVIPSSICDIVLSYLYYSL